MVKFLIELCIGLFFIWLIFAYFGWVLGWVALIAVAIFLALRS